MKKCKICFGIIMIFIIFFANISFATEIQPRDVISEENQDDTSNVENLDEDIMPISIDESDYAKTDTENNSGDLYIMQDNAEITNDTIFGDIYVMAENVNITSNLVDGNIFIIADKANINSTISGYAYILAKEVNFSGSIDGMYICANKVNISEVAMIRNDIKVCSEEFNLRGIINRNLLISAKNINIIRENSNANIYGKLTYSGNLNADEDLIIGKVTKIEKPKVEEKQEKDIAYTVIKEFIFSAVSVLIVITIILFIFKNNFKYEKREPVSYIKDIVIGLGLLIFIPIISVVLMITIIGLPIGMLAIIIYIIFLYLGLPVASIEIANQIFNEKLNTKLKKIFASLLVYVVLKLIAYIPIFGGIIKFLVVVLGFNIILNKIFKYNKIENNKIEVTKVIDTNEEENIENDKANKED